MDLATLLGVVIGLCLLIFILVLGFLRKDKFDGEMRIMEQDGKKVFSLELAGDPDDLSSKKSIVFKVVPDDPDGNRS